MAELADRGVVRLAFRRFVVARAAILPFRLLLLVELPFPGVLTPHFIQLKKTAIKAELADRGVVRLAFRRFVVARAAILPSRLLLLVELPFSGVLTPHFIQLKKTAIKAVFFNWWELRGSNSRPSRCKRDALPAELNSHCVYEKVYTLLKIINQAKNCTIFIFLLKLFYIK